MSNLTTTRWFLVMLSAWTLCAGRGISPAAVVINEIMASNNSTQTDPQKEYDDWIEFHNGGTASVDVAGMYVTDNLDRPTKWRFPTNDPTLTTIAPGGYLLLWADGDVADAGLHASFNVSAGGEEIALFDADGVTLLDSVSFGQQTVDVSYGRYPNGVGNWMVMILPTPGQENVGLISGVVAAPQFSQPRGFYDEPFTVELTTPTEGAEIYYRLDWVDPGAGSGHGPPGTKYTGPITINRTTCVRAVAAKDGWLPSPGTTATYIFLDQAIHQSASPAGFPASWGSNRVDYEMDPDVVNDPAYAPTLKEDLKAIPSVSIVIANKDFFGAEEGIYANAEAHGDAWERPASIEWIDPVKGTDFQVNVGLRAHGGVGRSNSVAKHSLRILFKSEYGPSLLEFPLFEDTDVDRFDSLVLRATWNYSYFGDSTACSGLGTSSAEYIRDQYARDTIRDMGGLVPHGRHVHLYINGLYWGMYILAERPDDGFAAQHLGGDKEDYDVLKASNSFGSVGFEVVAGDIEAWNTLMALAGGDLSSTEAYQTIRQYVDVQAMIDYLLMVYFVGSRDAPVLLCNNQLPRNFYTLRSHDPPGPFTFIAWDVEWSLERMAENRVQVVGRANPHYLLNRLMANDDFRILFADRVYRHFFHNGVLTATPAVQRYAARAGDIDRAIIGESARWGDSRRSGLPYTRDVEWVAEVDRLLTEYLPARPSIVMNQILEAGFYPPISPPEFLINNVPTYGGNIDGDDSLGMEATEGTIWYTLDGSDPRLPGSGAGPMEPSAWVAENAPKKVLVPTGPIDDNWRGGETFDDSAWISGAGGVGYERISDYKPYFSIDVHQQMFGISGTCYIRIPFTLSEEQRKDISSLVLRVRYDDAFVAYLNGTEVQRALVDGIPAWNSTVPTDHIDSDAMVLEAFDISAHINKLRDGQNILAIHGLNAGTTSSDFLISAELAASRDTGSAPVGVSPTALRYEGPITLEASTPVKARLLNGNTWSALADVVFAVGPVAQSLRISEIMYHPAETGSPDDPNTEYIELINIGSETINLKLVRFTRGVDFAFPSIELAPGRYCLLVKNVAAFTAKYSTGLPVAGQYAGSLSNGGERLTLQDAVGNVIHDFSYNDDWYDKADGEGFSLTIKDPRTADPNDYGDEDLWRSSTKTGGSPGAADQ